jgi:hypothetical protein
MNRQEFLDLSENEQQLSISESGNMLINFLQGDTRVSFYKLNELFVKVTEKENGYRHVEVNYQVNDFRLSQINS